MSSGKYMINQVKNNSERGLHKLVWNCTKYLYKIDNREICADIMQLLYEKLNSSDNNTTSKNESHPPIKYYRD